MAENKKFYWLKLKEDFFEEDSMDWILDQKNGKDILLFYMKLCLKSLKTEGILVRQVGKKTIPYDNKRLAELTKTSIKIVKVGIEMLKEIGLIEELSAGELYLTQIPYMVGSETKWAKYKRKGLEQELEKFQSNSNDTPKKLQTEIEIEKRDIDRENREESISPELSILINQFWDGIIKIFPKIETINKAKPILLEMLQDKEDKKEYMTYIYQACKLYIEDYKRKNEDDEQCKYIHGFAKFLQEDFPIWLVKVEQSKQNNVLECKSKHDKYADIREKIFYGQFVEAENKDFLEDIVHHVCNELDCTINDETIGIDIIKTLLTRKNTQEQIRYFIELEINNTKENNEIVQDFNEWIYKKIGYAI